MSIFDIYHRRASRTAQDRSVRLSKPGRNGARGGLGGAGIDFGLGQGAQRVIDDDGVEVGHAERGALHLGLIQEFGRDDDRRRPSQRFESDAVMRTARRA